MSRQVAELQLAVERAAADRAACVARYLVAVASIGRMVDELCELHGDLDTDDRLHQVLHWLGFVWQNVEAELIAAAGQARN